MEKRHSSPSPGTLLPRPSANRQRSNSLPMVEALGCSTPEAQLLLAEGRAAIRSRHASVRRGRRNRSENDGLPERLTTFHPRDHMKYLEGHDAASEEGSSNDQLASLHIRTTRHSRIPSNLSSLTDTSTSTIRGPTTPFVHSPLTPSASPGSPLEDYSANLAKFIKTQLSSITTQHAMAVVPRSSPELAHSPTPPQSPIRIARQVAGMPQVIEIPPVRPPLRSAFSAWSSADDDTDAEEDIPPMPSLDMDPPRKESMSSNHTLPLSHHYEDTNDASFLFTTTPLDEEVGEQGVHPNAEGFTFPAAAASMDSDISPEPNSPFQDHEEDYPSSALSSRPQLTTSSAPSFSSVSTASYFDCKRPISLAPQVRDRIIAAVSPHISNQKVIAAVSPFEGAALAAVHDIFVESQYRVHVDGLSFDLIGELNIPNAAMRVAPSITTPC